MIPTTLTASSSPIAISLNSSNSMTPVAQNSMSNPSNEMIIGLASLIIEGRAFAEDEFHTLSLRQTVPYPQTPPARGITSSSHSIDLREKPINTTASTSAASLLLHRADLIGFGGGGGGGVTSSNFGGGRQSPKPSTSKAATSNNNPMLINITTNPHHAFGAATAPLFIEKPNSYHSSSSAASSAESTHQRWTQKLCQLRQASGAANLAAPYEQKVAIEAVQGTSGEPELVSLAIHDASTTAERGAVGGDYEIVRRVMLSRSSAAVGAAVNVNPSGSASSSPSSGGSDNFLHSLQSLATTCLRGNSPSIDSPTGYATSHYNTSSSGSSNNSHTKYAPYRATTNATATPRFQSPYAHLDLQSGGSASSSGSCVQSSKLISLSSNFHKRGPKVTSTVTSSAPTAKATPSPSTSAAFVISSATAHASSPLATGSAATPTSQFSKSNSNPYPQQGPHCDQFLRKMGLAKGETAEAEEHYCDMSYVNITCSRWRAYCSKIEAIIEREEPICLEVFLGPANHKILLEQWIITYKEKVPPPTMTLSSLCSAIRSQLYFSQISAWCDLIRKSDKSIYDTGRIVYGGAAAMMGCAGDLATTAAASLSSTPPNFSNNPLAAAATTTIAISSGSSNGSTANGSATTSTTPSSTTASSSSSSLSTNLSRPRLNVFYRIRAHDSTACFNSKPNIHNFPNVNISENCSISICLKSLPRINGGIPKLGAMMAAPGENNAPTTNAAAPSKFFMDETPRSSRQQLSKHLSPTTPTAPTPSTACYPNCDNLKQQANDNLIGADSAAIIADNSNCYKNTTAAQLTPTCSSATLFDSNRAECKSVLAPTPAPASAASSSQEKCQFYIDENEQNSLDANDIDLDDDLSEPHCSNGSCGSLSHREKQLLKYRKRMLKRDKKYTGRRSFDDNRTPQQCQPMEQGDDYDDESEQSSVQTVALVTARQQRATIEMISTGTQTSAAGCCEQCGGEKALVCLKCNSQSGIDEMDACSTSSIEIISTPRSKGDLLLQAIQRTPKAAKHKKQNMRSSGSAFLSSTKSAPALNVRTTRSQSNHNMATESLNNNHLANNRSNSIACPPNGLSPSSSTSSIASLGSSCKECKRQKTQHNFAAFNGVNGRDINGCSLQQTCTGNQHFASENGAAEEAEASTEADDHDGGKKLDGNIDDFNEKKTSAGDSKPRNSAKVAAKFTASSGVDTTKAAPADVMEEECFPSTTILMHQFVFKPKLFDVGASTQQKPPVNSKPMRLITEECFVSSTKLTPNFEGFVLSGSHSNSSRTQQEYSANRQEQQQQQQPVVPTKPMRHGQCKSSTASTSQASSCTPTGPLALNIECEFKTPTSTASSFQEQQQQQQQQLHKSTPKPTLLQVSNPYSSLPAMKPECCNNSNCNNTSTIMEQTQFIALPLPHRSKTLPKVNLTPIFCNGNSCHMHHSNNTPLSISDATSSQIPESAFPFDIVTINRVKFERAAAAAAAAAQMCTANNNHQHHHQLHYNNNNNHNNNNKSNHNINNNNNNNNTATMFDSNAGAVPVQKSNSAPTLPNSPSLSPRFAKQAAIYKRRSRHLSDRSDRSSLGSDEQYSDEELDCGSNANLMNGMVISPMKQRARFANKFSRRPLLGNLEESLLQRRITPKMEVLGFKVLLGASGVFCPTQLTIPAAAYFYELHGETLSTPYLCEIGLPRKGYSVPRTGTVQVTLLNPLGTVVRMFVIPYDMHDMPPLHQTFIRQRVLADEMSAAISAPNDKQANLELTNGMANADVSMTHHNGQLENNFQQSSSKANVGDGYKQKTLGHFISAEHMKRLRYCIHLRFQTSRSGRLMLHTDIRLLISRRTDCDTAAAHAKGVLEAPNELITDTVMPSNPKYSVRQDVNSRI